MERCGERREEKVSDSPSSRSADPSRWSRPATVGQNKILQLMREMLVDPANLPGFMWPTLFIIMDFTFVRNSSATGNRNSRLQL